MIAVKQVNYTNLDKKDRSQQVKALETEIQMLKQLKHPNIVKYLGTHRDKHRMYIFLEYGNDISVGNNDDEDCCGSLDDLFYQTS